MTNGERKQKAARMAPPDALALPHVVEAIATSSTNQEDFRSFLRAVPPYFWTPALAAFLDCNTAMPPSVRASWPRIVLRLNDMNVPPTVLALLAATLPLHPRIELQYPIQEQAELASLVAVLGPALSSVTLYFYSDRMVHGRGRAMSSLLLQRCPRLRRVSIGVISYSENVAVELNDLLAVVTHPHVEALTLDLQQATGAPRLGHLLASWLSTAPATNLEVANVMTMDFEAAIAFCNALQANTTLQELVVINVPSLGGFHGRTLPASLKTLEWREVGNDATMHDLATAVGHTQLEHFDCTGFGQLASCPAAAPMLAQLQFLVVSGLDADHMETLIAGLSSVPALTSIMLYGGNLPVSMELLMVTLATTCAHLRVLSVSDEHMTRNGSAAVLFGVLRLPHLTSLSLEMRLPDVLNVLPVLVVAGRHLRYLHLRAIERATNGEKRAICEALARVHDVPFVLRTLPANVNNSVVDALSRRADRLHQCDLRF